MSTWIGRLSSRLAWLVAASGVTCSPQQGLADTRPSSAAVKVGEWWFAPIVSDQPSTCQTVHSVLALSTKVDTVGNNLVAVWYVRPGTTEEMWTAWTWESSDPWDAIKYVRDTLGISESCGNVWPTSDVQYAGPGQTPVVYDKGFVETDLVGQAIGPAPDRDIWIDVLKDIGYQVADVVFDKTPLEGQVVHCDQKGWLNTMAASVEMTLFDLSESQGTVLRNTFVSECQPGLTTAVVIPMADILTPAPLPVLAPGWTPVAPSPANPVPGRVSPWSCVWSSAGGGTCTCTSTFYNEWTGAGPCPGATWAPPMATCLCIIRGMTTCVSASACAANSCPATGPNPNPADTVPGPTGNQGYALGCNPGTCTITYEYWMR